jgi:two-component system, LytTR family, sensor kinase
MRTDEFTIERIVSAEEKSRSRKFWLYSFGVYVIGEGLYILINYITTWSMCNYCVLAAPYYFLHWILNIAFTGMLWYILNLFYQQRKGLIVLSNLFVFAAYYFLWILVQYQVLNSKSNWLLGVDTRDRPYSSLFYSSWFDIGKYVVKLAAFYVLKFYYEYRRAERNRIQQAVINKDMQLNLLKQQLSPHFYFNTLNNLYGLARSDSAKLPEALDQLSNIMQYVIVDCNQPKVLLEQEVRFLGSYIALEKLRYEQDTVIEMKVEGAINGQTIIPLLLIQFVENAFKHGMKEKSDKNWMKTTITVQNQELLFTVDNSYYETGVSEGIGIRSVNHILNLQYEGKHDIQMNKVNNHFSVTLKLNLS